MKIVSLDLLYAFGAPLYSIILKVSGESGEPVQSRVGQVRGHVSTAVKISSLEKHVHRFT